MGDGEFHDIKLSTVNHPQWRGYITELRLDPGNEDGVEVAIESIRLVEDAPAK